MFSDFLSCDGSINFELGCDYSPKISYSAGTCCAVMSRPGWWRCLNGCLDKKKGKRRKMWSCGVSFFGCCDVYFSLKLGTTVMKLTRSSFPNNDSSIQLHLWFLLLFMKNHILISSPHQPLINPPQINFPSWLFVLTWIWSSWFHFFFWVKIGSLEIPWKLETVFNNSFLIFWLRFSLFFFGWHWRFGSPLELRPVWKLFSITEQFKNSLDKWKLFGKNEFSLRIF